MYNSCKKKIARVALNILYMRQIYIYSRKYYNLSYEDRWGFKVDGIANIEHAHLRGYQAKELKATFDMAVIREILRYSEGVIL